MTNGATYPKMIYSPLSNDSNLHETNTLQENRQTDPSIYIRTKGVHYRTPFFVRVAEKRDGKGL